MTVPMLQRRWLLMGYGVTSTPRLFLRHLGTRLRFGDGLLLRYFAVASRLTGRLARAASLSASARFAAMTRLRACRPAFPASFAPCCGLTPARALPASRLLSATRGGLLRYGAFLFFRRGLAALFLLR